MHTRNPFHSLDHIKEESPDLKERVMESARRELALMQVAGLFTGGYLKTFLRALTDTGPAKPLPPPTEGPTSKPTSDEQ